VDRNDFETSRIEELARGIVLAHREGHGETKMVPIDAHPMPGEYVITGVQAGNFQGERGWRKYIGYVAQVRLKAGAYGTDMVFLRHPDGGLMTHENQSFYRPVGEFLEQVRAIFPPDMTPELTEDHTKEYSIEGRHPRAGAIVPPETESYAHSPGPMATVTLALDDGSRVVEVI
jgi:hypothetical protein